MNQKRIYIQAAEQISIQEPLSEQWMTEPLMHEELLVHAKNPVFRNYMAPNEARRMANIMKRAIVTTLKVLGDTGIEHPDAIVTGTSIGCLDYTERFLDDMVNNGEQALSPTYFMQSTHNTVSSALGIHTKSHGYNCTYSHGAISFELAMLDAWMQIRLDKISTALVGGYDEMVDSYYELLRKAEYVGQDGMVPCGEVSVSMMLNTEPGDSSLCQLGGLRIIHNPSIDEVKAQLDSLLQEGGIGIGDISAVMTGINGKPSIDKCYEDAVASLFPTTPAVHYKHIFGENYTSPALAVYAAAHCLKNGSIPAFMNCEEGKAAIAPENILLLNITEGNDYSLILLKKA